MNRPLNSYPISSTHKIKLANAGYESTEDLKNVHVTELSKGEFLISLIMAIIIYII